eukprot:317295_1
MAACNSSLSCICGNYLWVTTPLVYAQQANQIHCDICEQSVHLTDIIYHCENADKYHDNGYDLCEICALYQMRETNMKVNNTTNLNILKTNDKECNSYNNCSYLKRLMTALSHYHTLSPENTDQCVDFINTHYPKQYLQDYIHFICVHKNDIDKINNMIKTICTNSNTCFSTQRHFRDRMQNENYLNVCIDILDTIHFYIYHMEECGLRISVHDSFDINNKYKDEI